MASALRPAAQHIRRRSIRRPHSLHWPVKAQRRSIIRIDRRIEVVRALHLRQAHRRQILRLAILIGRRPGRIRLVIRRQRRRLIGLQTPRVIRIIRVLHKRQRHRAARVHRNPVHPGQTQAVRLVVDLVHHRQHVRLLARRHRQQLVPRNKHARRWPVERCRRSRRVLFRVVHLRKCAVPGRIHRAYLLFRHILDRQRQGSREPCNAESRHLVVIALPNIVVRVHKLQRAPARWARVLHRNQNTVRYAARRQHTTGEIIAIPTARQNTRGHHGRQGANYKTSLLQNPLPRKRADSPSITKQGVALPSLYAPSGSLFFAHPAIAANMTRGTLPFWTPQPAFGEQSPLFPPSPKPLNPLSSPLADLQSPFLCQSWQKTAQKR